MYWNGRLLRPDPGALALRAKQFDIRQMTNEEIWNDPSIEIVLNTTYPLSHYEVTKRSLEAGKHVLTEKMVAVELNEGKELVELARSKGLFFISAPDTFLGGGWQTARHLLDSGVIGDPVAVHAACVRSYQDHSEEEALYKAFTLSRGGGIPFARERPVCKRSLPHNFRLPTGRHSDKCHIIDLPARIR